LIGLHPQYRAAAALLIESLQNGMLESALTGDPEAGRVDDFQILTGGRLDAYQFKWSQYRAAITLRSLITGKAGAPSLFRSLADGWLNRQNAYPEKKIMVHLASNGIPSNSIKVTKGRGNKLGQNHFAAFLDESWFPVHEGVITMPLAGEPWHDTWEKIRGTTGLENTRFSQFVRECKLDFLFPINAPTGISKNAQESWEAAVRALTERLLSLPSKPNPVISLDRKAVFRLLDWKDESIPFHRHDFTLASYVNEPLRRTAADLEGSLDRICQGYICLRGTPGSGKSSTLTLIFRRRPERVIKYYAFTPDSPNGSQGEAVNFLSDLVADLERQGIRSDSQSPHRGDLVLLRERFRRQLKGLGEDYAKKKRKTLILIDGLDHIEREQSPARSLLLELPRPCEIPEGVVIVLGTQEQGILGSDIRQSLLDSGRSIKMSSLGSVEIDRILQEDGLSQRLNSNQRGKIMALVAGHPLALGYLLRKLNTCQSAGDLDVELSGQLAFTGNILSSYRSLWDQSGTSERKVRHLLGMIARLRRAPDDEWLGAWADLDALDQLKNKFGHYFERNNGTWQFFHNSFRIFVLEVSSRDIDGNQNLSLERRFHLELADRCANTPSPSLWRYEQFHHLVEAGNQQAALEIARPEWFREQFFAMRQSGAIRADLGCAWKMLGTVNSGPAACRLMFASDEIESRTETLQLDDLKLLLLFLRTKEAPHALNRIRTGAQLHQGSMASLQICATLLDTGNTSEARRIFELVDPHGISTYGMINNSCDELRQLLIHWSGVAVSFLSIQEILRVIDRSEFRNVSSWNQNPEPSPVDQKIERQKTLAGFSISLAASGRHLLSEQLEEYVEWGILQPTWRIELLLTRLESASAENDQLIQELLALEPSSSDVSRLRIAEILFRLGKADLSLTVFSKVKTPDMAEIGRFSALEGKSLREAERWSRLAYALGTTRAISSVVISREDNPIRILLADSRSAVVRLHAAAWNGQIWDGPALDSAFQKAFSPLLRGYLRWDTGNDVNLSMPQIATDLVNACKEQGQSCVSGLCNYLTSAWNDPNDGRNWLDGIMRQLVVDLCKAGAAPEWTTNWLQQLESRIESSSAAGSRVSELIDQAHAWMTAAQPEKSLLSVKTALQLSLGIGYDRDYQLNSWMDCLKDTWRGNWRGGKDLIVQLARSIAALDEEVSGGTMGEAAELLIANSFRAEPGLGLKLWDYLAEHGAVSFPETLAVVIQEALAQEESDPTVTVLLLAEILIPLDARGRPDLLVTAVDKVHQLRGAGEAQNAVNRFARRIETLARGETRKRWRNGLRQVCRSCSLILPERAGKNEPLVKWRESEATDDIAAMVFSSKDPFDEFERQVKLALDDRSEHRAHIEWTEIAILLAPELSELQFSSCRQLFKDNSYWYARIGENLAPFLTRAGLHKILWDWGYEVFDQLKQHAESNHVADREWLSAQIMLSSADLARGREHLFDSLSRHRWLGLHSLQPMMDSLAANPEEKEILADEIAGQLAAILQGSDTGAPELTLDEIDASPSIPTSQALVRLVLSWIDHPTRLVRHSTRRVIRNLCRSGNKDWLEEIGNFLKDWERGSTLVRLLDSFDADELAASSPSIAGHLADFTSSLDLDTRISARNLKTRLSGDTPYPRLNKSFSLIYEIELPPLDFDRLSTTVKKLWPILSTCQRITGIPIQNLCQRSEELAIMVSDRSRLPTTRKEMEWMLRKANLTFGYQLPDSRIGIRAAFRLLGELNDYGFISEQKIQSLIALFSREDHFLSRSAPSERPRALMPPDTGMKVNAWNEEWLEQGDERPIRVAPHADEGWLIGCYVHSFFIPTDHLPEESHFGWLTTEKEDDSEEGDGGNTIIDEDKLLEAARYHDWHGKDDEGAFFLLSGSLKDLPSPSWLALHPKVARSLGWQAEQSRLFAWQDRNGVIMAESRWWADGPPDCVDTNGRGTTSSGWLVALSPPGYALLEAGYPNLRFDSQSRRSHRL